MRPDTDRPLTRAECEEAQATCDKATPGPPRWRTPPMCEMRELSREARSLARDVAERLREPRCWSHGQAWSDSGGECLAVAIMAVAAMPLSGELVNWINDTTGVDNVASWNDAPERTHAEVLALLRAAAGEEEAK